MGKATVNWIGRKLGSRFNPFGNHHYILILIDKICLPTGIPTQRHNGAEFLTLGGFSINDNMVFVANDVSDNLSAKDLLDNTPIWDFFNPFDWGTQKHYVKPPGGNDTAFANQVIRLAEIYGKNTAVEPLPYRLFSDNCAAWVNTLFKVAGVPQHEREELGQFWGIDAAERVEIPEHLFQTKTSYMPTLGTYPTR